MNDSQNNWQEPLAAALFSPPKPRKQHELIADIITRASELQRLLEALEKFDPQSAEIEESIEFAEGIFTDMVAYRKELNKPYVPHEFRCPCDSCVAARSDEHFDRKRDGEIK